jgi:cysteine desulfuration protein SufE
MLDIEDIAANFAFLDDWSERYRYLIELGRELDPLPEPAHNEVNRVKGCASQVWLETEVSWPDGEPVLRFRGDSDAHIVKGLIYLALALYGDRPARDIAEIDATQWFVRLGLSEHLTPQRSNGFRAMVERIRRDAREALAPQHATPPSVSSPAA